MHRIGLGAHRAAVPPRVPSRWERRTTKGTSKDTTRDARHDAVRHTEQARVYSSQFPCPASCVSKVHRALVCLPTLYTHTRMRLCPPKSRPHLLHVVIVAGRHHIVCQKSVTKHCISANPPLVPHVPCRVRHLRHIDNAAHA